MAISQWVINVSGAEFDEKVVAASRERPVVIDFWAPWCGPCRSLGPLLERMAAERAGEFLLAKVNVDENQDLAQSFQVNGIPAVFAVRDGKLIDQFEGLLPEDQLAAFLDGLVPSEAETKTGLALEQEGRDPAAAAATYREMLAVSPDEPAARVGLARVLLAKLGSEVEAKELLRGIDSGEYANEAARLKTIISLRLIPHGDDDLAAAKRAVAKKSDDASARHALGAILAARGEYIAALGELLAAADDDRALGRGAVRELMVRIFDVIGPRSPEADDYRKKLQMLLY